MLMIWVFGRLRAPQRDHNRRVLGLDEPLAILDGDWRPDEVYYAPPTGRAIKALDREYWAGYFFGSRVELMMNR